MHGCSGNRMLLEHERNYDLGMDALLTVCSWNTNGIIFGHGCSGNCMLLEHERNYDFGMDALGSFRTAGTDSSTPCTHVRSYLIGLCDKQSAEA